MAKLLSVVVASALFATPALAHADEAPQRFGWDPAWRRFDAAEYTLTGAVALSAGTLHMFVNPNRDPPWDAGPILFDAPVRDAIRAKGREDLTRARDVGNVMNVAVFAQTLVVDSLIVPIARGSGDVAWQMTWMNAEAFGTSGLTTWLLFTLVGRARPSWRECDAETTDDPLCKSGISSGFPSGHAASAFTAAGLACAHHSNVPLYGGGVPDALACFGALAVATGAGTMRLVGDRHYTTDLLAGATIGLAIGYAMPTFLHYRARPRPAEEARDRHHVRVGWSLGADSAPLGASLFGRF